MPPRPSRTGSSCATGPGQMPWSMAHRKAGQPYGAGCALSTAPQRRAKAELVGVAGFDANTRSCATRCHELRRQAHQQRAAVGALAPDEPPWLRIEVLDISTIHGSYGGSMVVCSEQQPTRTSTTLQDQALDRATLPCPCGGQACYRQNAWPLSASAASRPHHLLDGGKPQLSAALSEIIRADGHRDIAMCGPGQARRRELFVPGGTRRRASNTAQRRSLHTS